MESFKLKKKPIMVGTAEGQKEITELKYDFENFTAGDKRRAGIEAKHAGINASVQELDSDYHFFLFAFIAAKCNPGVTIEDIMRVHAKDSIDAAALVRSYFFIDMTSEE